MDFGVYNTPKSWNDITLKQLTAIQTLYGGKKPTLLELLPILTNHSKEEVEALPIEFTEKLLQEMSFLTEPLPSVTPSPSIIINGEKYEVNIQEKLRTGEFVATQMALQGDEHNYAALLAIVARKEGEIYDSTFENEVIPQRIKLFEEAKAMEVMPLVSFFLNSWAISELNSQLFSVVEEEINDLSAKLTEISRQGGVGRKLYTRRLMKKLNKLKRSINFT